MKKPKQPKAKNAGKARKAPKSAPLAAAPKSTRAVERDPRLPAVGTTIVRPYKGKDIRVKVLADGFEFEGEHYRSLTKVALVATGYAAISGPAFFRLTERRAPAKPTVVKRKANAAPATSVEPTEPAPETATPTS